MRDQLPTPNAHCARMSLEFINDTELQATWHFAFDLEGREVVYTRAKVTYQLPPEDPTNRGRPDANAPLQLAQKQLPLVEADEHFGEPGKSATRYESDFAQLKPRCDVLVIGSAYAPRQQPTRSVDVGFACGSLHKTLTVSGAQYWDQTLTGLRASDPEPFLTRTLTYDLAYGGSDVLEEKPEQCETYRQNPVGCGFYPLSAKEKKLGGKRIASIHERGRPAVEPVGQYAPLSLTPLARNVASRLAFTGTYDEKWLNERVPLMPLDFDMRYFQCAPDDQQMPYPRGGELVMLQNLTPTGNTSFRLPQPQLTILYTFHNGRAVQHEAVVDTVTIEPDKGVLTMCYRASMAMPKSCFDIRQLVVGRTAEQHRVSQRRAGKPHYKGLGELVRAQLDQKKRGS